LETLELVFPSLSEGFFSTKLESILPIKRRVLSKSVKEIFLCFSPKILSLLSHTNT